MIHRNHTTWATKTQRGSQAVPWEWKPLLLHHFSVSAQCFWNPMNLVLLFFPPGSQQFPTSLSVLMGWTQRGPLFRTNMTLDPPIHNCIVLLTAALIQVTVTGPHIGTLSSTSKGAWKVKGRWQHHSRTCVGRRPRERVNEHGTWKGGYTEPLSHRTKIYLDGKSFELLTRR